MGKIIGFTYDLREDFPLKETDPIDLNAEFDKKETIDFIKSAIEAAGHKVVLIGNVRNLLKRLPNLGVDLVFNICEGRGLRNRESQVPVILETFGIPYLGSDGLTMSLTLDKIMTKKILLAEGIPTPKYMPVNQMDDLINLDHLEFPLIVKLRQEGTSKGLNNKSVVHNIKELEDQAQYLFNQYNDTPLLIEEVILGTEFTVPIIGNTPPEALPSVQVLIDEDINLGEKIYTFDCVIKDNLSYICPAKISKALENKIADLSIKTYKAVSCRDFGRVDLRLDKDNNPYVLEINTLPSLAPDDAFNLSPQVAGYDYNTAIKKIIDAGLKRLGID